MLIQKVKEEIKRVIVLAEGIDKEEIYYKVKHQLEACVISKKSKCNKINCINHILYDSSANGYSKPPCKDYISFEEALWNGWGTGN